MGIGGNMASYHYISRNGRYLGEADEESAPSEFTVPTAPPAEPQRWRWSFRNAKWDYQKHYVDSVGDYAGSWVDGEPDDPTFVKVDAPGPGERHHNGTGWDPAPVPDPGARELKAMQSDPLLKALVGVVADLTSTAEADVWAAIKAKAGGR